MQALLNAISQMHNTADAHRVFHGRGGMYPDCEQWTLDWFAPVWVLTSFKPVTDEALAQCQSALQARWDTLAPGEPLNWVFQCRAQGEAETRLMAGSVPEPHVVTEQGAKYLVHVMRGQNHGLFLDMANGREWLKRHAKHENILNLFAYTCAFTVVALQGGAAQVVNLDMRNHGRSDWHDSMSYALMAEDVKETLDKLGLDQVMLLGHSMGGKTISVGYDSSNSSL